MIDFLVMYFGVVVFFSLVAYIQGVKTWDDEVMPPALKGFLDTFRTSFGDPQLPDTELWRGDGNDDNKSDIMLILIYLTWLLNIVISFFLLCNFLIARVGETHSQAL